MPFGFNIVSQVVVVSRLLIEIIIVMSLSPSICVLVHPNSEMILSKIKYARSNVCNNQNQRTNGPVNAHLRPEIYT